MTDVLVSVDAHKGILCRYVMGGKDPLLTHMVNLGQTVIFTQEVIEEFRLRPSEQDRVPVNPFDPPPPAGGTPVAARVKTPLRGVED